MEESALFFMHVRRSPRRIARRIQMKAVSVFEEYVAKIDRAYRTGKATEHTYRGALTDLIAALLPDTVVQNEPKRIACGAPDLIITRAKLPVAFIEAKDIGEGDLDGRFDDGRFICGGGY